jgi:hypothetical protein
VYVSGTTHQHFAEMDRLPSTGMLSDGTHVALGQTVVEPEIYDLTLANVLLDLDPQASLRSLLSREMANDFFQPILTTCYSYGT